MEYKRYESRWRIYVISSPLIYMMIIPLVFLDICMTIYKEICFRIYEIPLPKRSEYIIIDRQKLSYLSPIDKINCAYCGYANGLAAYLVKITGDTERFWCGIQHEKEFEQSEKRYYAKEHHKDFLKYGDEEGYEQIANSK